MLQWPGNKKTNPIHFAALYTCEKKTTKNQAVTLCLLYSFFYILGCKQQADLDKVSYVLEENFSTTVQ